MTFSAAICAATIAARIACVTAAAFWSRWRCRGNPGRRDEVALSSRAAVVAGWCGMRGIVTLAAALALPTEAFPFRDLVIFAAFAVVLGTLVLQGMTLRPLLLALRLQPDRLVEREVRIARVETLRAALAAIGEAADEEMARLMRRRYQAMLRRAEAQLAGAADGNDDERRAFCVDVAIVRRATSAERSRLLALRADGTIGAAAFQRVEQEFDLEELDLQQLAPDAEA